MKHSAVSIQHSAGQAGGRANAFALSTRRIAALLLPFTFLAGCQIHPVQLRGTGRTVSLDEIRRTQRSAHERLSRVAARLDIEEWQHDGALATARGDNAATSQPGDDSSARIGELPMRGTRTQYVWDAGHQRLAMRIQPLSPGSTTLPAEGNSESPRFCVIQKTPEGDELEAVIVADQVMLERFPQSGERRAYIDWPLKHGLENDMFFSMAANWAGKLEASSQEGLDLVKVTWSAMGADTIEWFRPDQGFRLHRKETRDLQKRLQGRIVANDYRNVNGFPYPFSYEVTSWDNWDATRMTQVMRCQVHSADFAARVTDEDFMIDVPAGATISLTLDQPSLLPRMGTRSRISERVDRAMRTDITTLFGMGKPSSRPAESADAQPG